MGPGTSIPNQTQDQLNRAIYALFCSLTNQSWHRVSSDDQVQLSKYPIEAETFPQAAEFTKSHLEGRVEAEGI